MEPAPYGNWAVVGGGVLGLTLALRLAQSGRRVTVIEAAPTLGGLASAWKLGPVTWDRHYHVTLLSDTHLRGLLDELGLDRDMVWRNTGTGFFRNGRLHPMSDAIDYLLLPSIGPVAKLRLATTILYASRIDDGRPLERVPVEEWLVRLSGRRAFERVWLPLLRAKLGNAYKETSAAFIWATIRRLYAARRSGLKREMFGYLPGGYARILERMSERLHEHGVTVRVACPVDRIDRCGTQLAIHCGGGAAPSLFDAVVVTAPANRAARLCPTLSAEERLTLDAVRYQGIVCASLLLRRPLSPYYLTYICDPAPFTAVVEMSTLVDPARFGGHSLVYLPRYAGPDDLYHRLDDHEVIRRFLEALRRMHPALADGDVAAARVSRVREVFALPMLNHSDRLPPMVTSVPGLYLVNSAQIVDGTLNVNETVALAERAARRIVADGRAAALAA